jgi:hypothetical protein
MATETPESNRKGMKLATQTRRLTGLEPNDYEELLGRFLRDWETKLQGRLKTFPDLKRDFQAWQAQEGGRRVPLLCVQFFKVCRDFGAAAYKSAAVRFTAEGESSIDAAMYNKWQVKEPPN